VRHPWAPHRPRLERDWTSWLRRSGARGTWRRSRSAGAIDWCPSDTVFARGAVCLTSLKERRTALQVTETSEAMAGRILGESIFPGIAWAK
jgi:hypothetical protein